MLLRTAALALLLTSATALACPGNEQSASTGAVAAVGAPAVVALAVPADVPADAALALTLEPTTTAGEGASVVVSVAAAQLATLPLDPAQPASVAHDYVVPASLQAFAGQTVGLEVALAGADAQCAVRVHDARIVAAPVAIN